MGWKRSPHGINKKCIHNFGAETHWKSNSSVSCTTFTTNGGQYWYRSNSKYPQFPWNATHCLPRKCRTIFKRSCKTTAKSNRLLRHVRLYTYPNGTTWFPFYEFSWTFHLGIFTTVCLPNLTWITDGAPEDIHTLVLISRHLRYKHNKYAKYKHDDQNTTRRHTDSICIRNN